MKKIAKILAMFAIFALAFSFAGCKSDDSDSSDDDVTISGGSTSGNGSSNGSSSGSNTSGGGNSGNTSDNTSGGSSSGGSDTGDSSGSGSGSGNTTGGGSESGSTGGTTSGSIEQIPEGFVKIPAASITGTESWKPESEVFVNERKFEIASFYMSDHEVTQAEYQVVMGSNPSRFKDGVADGEVQENRPVEQVSWYDALVYCNKRSIAEGLTPCYTISSSTDPSEWGAVPTSNNEIWNAVTCEFTANGYRLPTEAEWEYAARNCNRDKYDYAGSSKRGDVAWNKDNSSEKTHEVKKKAANGLGLYDMSGNVWEWCWDWYGNIKSSTTSTGVVTSGSYRVERGGSFTDFVYFCTVAKRWYGSLYCQDYYLGGLRVVRTAK